MIYFQLIMSEEKNPLRPKPNMYFIMLFDYEKRIYKFFRNVLWESLWVLPQMISRTENFKKIEI